MWRICGCSDPALFGLWMYHKSLALGDALLCKWSPRRARSKENLFALTVPAWLNHRVTINKEKETAARKLITWNCLFLSFAFPRMVQCIICMFQPGRFCYILMRSLFPTVVMSLFSHITLQCSWGFLKLPSNLIPCVIVLVVICLSWAESSNRWHKRDSRSSPN